MSSIHIPTCRKLCIPQLRTGIPIGISLKATADERPTTNYIWRTSGDNKVRTSHAANNGKIFAWSNPPETGHPGEDFNCRCTAEPYVQGSTEFAYQTLISSIDDVSPKWTNVDLTRHFYLGGGRGVSLTEIGHLQGVIDHYFHTLGTYANVNAQIVDAARNHLGNEFSYQFDGSYDFESYLYVFGDGVVSGIFVGSSNYQNGMLVVKGEVEYFYDDTFTDPADFRELVSGTSNPEDMSWIGELAEFGGSYFPMKDYWKTEFHAEVKLNPEHSIYRWPK